MNNTIEDLQALSKLLVSCTEWVPSVIGHYRKALTDAIATLKAVESADGLPERREELKKEYPTRKEMTDIGVISGFNEYHDIAKPILAKQILKVMELEHTLSKVSECTCIDCGAVLMNRNDYLPVECPYCRANRLMAHNKELEAKIKEINPNE